MGFQTASPVLAQAVVPLRVEQAEGEAVEPQGAEVLRAVAEGVLQKGEQGGLHGAGQRRGVHAGAGR